MRTAESVAAQNFVSRKRLGSVGSALGRVLAWVLAPAVLMLAILFLPCILASSRESPVWRQKRVGYRGADFWVPKFSTMNVDASGELRETWFGRIIRPLGLDEVLQILMIAKGDMQWFGPRPLLRADLDEHYIESVLSLSKPGLFSSRSLVTGIGNRALQDGKITLAEMARYDLSDLEQWSFTYAATLLRDTVFMVATRGIRVNRGGGSDQDFQLQPNPQAPSTDLHPPSQPQRLATRRQADPGA